MTAKEIIQEWLKENGYDGLCNPDCECGCFLVDLFPCGEDPSLCVAGHKVMQDDGDWIILEGKAK